MIAARPDRGWLKLTTGPHLSLVLVFTLFGFTVNYFRISLFFDIDFIFGSAFAILALVLLGLQAALFVGIVAASATLLIWLHPFGWILFSGEIIWLAWRFSKTPQTNLVMLDLQYWLLALPIMLSCYTLVLESPWQTALLIGLKQLSNGIFNTLIVCLLLAALQMHKALSRRLVLPEISLRQLVFLTLLSVTLLAGSVPLILDARKSRNDYEQAVASRLAELTAIIQLQLTKTVLASGAFSVAPAELFSQFFPADTEYALALVDQQQQVIPLVGQTLSLDAASLDEMIGGFSRWQPATITLPLQGWRQSRYVYVLPIRLGNNASWLVLEQPASSVVAKLEQDSAEQLLRLVLFLGLAIGLSVFLSKAISLPLGRIDLASRRIETDLQNQLQTSMPESRVAEYSSLSHTLAQLSARLFDAFERNRVTQYDLEHLVAERTAALEQSYRQQTAIFSAASDFSIIATDAQGIIQFFSLGAERMLGYQASELVGKHSPELLHEPAEVALRAEQLSQALSTPIRGFRAFVVKAEQAGSETHEWTYLHKDGHAIPVSLTVTVIRDEQDKVCGYLGIARDISERHRTEQLKTEFISTVSHELRTPLTSIYAALRLVNSGKLGDINPTLTKLLRVAEQNSERLTILINDLLDIEKLISGKFQMPLAVQPLAPLLETAVESLMSYAKEYQITFKLELPTMPLCANVNAERLIQVIVNLLSNAIKFSPVKAVISLKLLQQAHQVRLEITDLGEGIADEFKPRIFEKFAQGDAASNRRKGGTGLGLAISKELTEKMGGQIGFTSQHGQGSTFWLAFALVDTTLSTANFER